MKKITTKYLSLIVLFLFVGATNVFANTSADTNNSQNNLLKIEASNHASTKNYLSHGSQITIHNNEEIQLIFDFTEIEDTENEESVSNTTIVPFSSYISVFLNAQLLSDLSAQLQEEATHYKPKLCQPTTKLHVRLSVFII
ncbi:hypothetical protein [Lacinutrix algicola]|uniref:hypothetical protein n=1 Tax=Lacinutrix algicola TaxID=342954 RepID=UPI0006E31FD2|nr:hypothetical protein [Lacinutrix algicola]